MAKYRGKLPQLSDAVFIMDGGLEEFGRQYRALRQKFDHLNVLGGCCGTDQRRLEAICRAVRN